MTNTYKYTILTKKEVLSGKYKTKSTRYNRIIRNIIRDKKIEDVVTANIIKI